MEKSIKRAIFDGLKERIAYTGAENAGRKGYAVYAYYFLVMAVIRGIIEVRSGTED